MTISCIFISGFIFKDHVPVLPQDQLKDQQISTYYNPHRSEITKSQR